MKHETTDPETRREFLKTGMVLGAGAVAAALVPGAAIAEPIGQGLPKPEHRGYQVTQHVLDYYRTARG